MTDPAQTGLIVSGWLRVAAGERDQYVTDSAEVVRAARAAPGCLDFAIAADVVDTERITIYERWTDEPSLLAFRGSGPSDEQQTRIVAAEVQRYVISSVEPA
ncbi:antibiotic biosynthesis monooxygenase [Aldersonia sp. NBC_00410]|uniref:putative quinol monooxygenase n=1 Tax=Aldersonia sp. NBC_00410 TaxID=2975954 RepID=UPI00225A414A|nr:antibiotic biosynthesis monooxygenase [Aldersonia sp. NBC_00410]MCX5045245.1 antibiotic biosynthesis monooxygenase [Aldersonia sp. NBC_00410]